MIDVHDARIGHFAVLASAAADKIGVILKAREPSLGPERAVNGGKRGRGITGIISGEVPIIPARAAGQWSGKFIVRKARLGRAQKKCVAAAQVRGRCLMCFFEIGPRDGVFVGVQRNDPFAQ